MAQLSPLLIPPFNGTNTRKAKVTADVRYEISYALSPVRCTVTHSDMTNAQRTVRYALDDTVATKFHSMLTSYELSHVGCTSYTAVCTPVYPAAYRAIESAITTGQRTVRYALGDISTTRFYNVLTSYGLSLVGCTSYTAVCTPRYTAASMPTGHTTARDAFATGIVLTTGFPYMLTAPFSRQLSAVYRYQTLWTDEHWSDAIKEKYILESVLPDDFVLSVYYAASRDMLAQQSNKKSKPKLKKVLTGCPAEDYRVKRVHEPTVDLKTLNKTQLVAEVLKRDEMITSMHQELTNYAQLKSANKKYATDLVAAEEQATAFSATLDELHNLVSAKETMLEQAEVLTVDQAKAMAGMTEAQVKDKQSIATLEFRLSEAVTMHTQKQQTITDMQAEIMGLTRQAEADADGLSDCWKKICVKGGAADNYEKLWRKGTQSRKLEQASHAQLQLELDLALETINRLQSEAHDTSMEDIHAGATPIGQLQPGLASPSPGLLLSDIKSDDQATPAAPSYSAKAAASAPVPSYSSKAAVPAVPSAPVSQGSSEGSAGAEVKEELLAQYRELGQRVMTV